MCEFVEVTRLARSPGPGQRSQPARSGDQNQYIRTLIIAGRQYCTAGRTPDTSHFKLATLAPVEITGEITTGATELGSF